jgi:tRNA A-37 threonylcarbamoyl transferase component Bud32
MSEKTTGGVAAALREIRVVDMWPISTAVTVEVGGIDGVDAEDRKQSVSLEKMYSTRARAWSIVTTFAVAGVLLTGLLAMTDLTLGRLTAAGAFGLPASYQAFGYVGVSLAVGSGSALAYWYVNRAPPELDRNIGTSPGTALGIGGLLALLVVLLAIPGGPLLFIGLLCGALVVAVGLIVSPVVLLYGIMQRNSRLVGVGVGAVVAGIGLAGLLSVLPDGFPYILLCTYLAAATGTAVLPGTLVHRFVDDQFLEAYAERELLSASHDARVDDLTQSAPEAYPLDCPEAEDPDWFESPEQARDTLREQLRLLDSHDRHLEHWQTYRPDATGTEAERTLRSAALDVTHPARYESAQVASDAVALYPEVAELGSRVADAPVSTAQFLATTVSGELLELSDAETLDEESVDRVRTLVQEAGRQLDIATERVEFWHQWEQCRTEYYEMFDSALPAEGLVALHRDTTDRQIGDDDWVRLARYQELVWFARQIETSSETSSATIATEILEWLSDWEPNSTDPVYSEHLRAEIARGTREESEYDAGIALIDIVLDRLRGDVTGHSVDADSEGQARVSIRNRLDWLETKGRLSLRAGREAAEAGEYHRALDRTDWVADELAAAADQVASAVDTESLTAVREETTESRRDWARARLVDRIESATAFEPGRTAQARTELEEVISGLAETELLSGQEVETIREFAHEAYITVCTRGAEHSLARGQEHVAESEYEAALERFDGATDLVSGALQRADGWENIDTDELSDIRERTEKHRGEARLAALEERFESALEQFEAGKQEQAEKQFRAISTDTAEMSGTQLEGDRLTYLAEAAAANAETAHRVALGINEGTTSLQRLSETDGVETEQSRRESDHTGPEPAARSAVNGGPPAAVPGGPDISVSYDTLDRGASIGSGGNANVSQATVEIDGDTQTVALKQPRVEGTLATQVVEEFVREANTWAKLDDHPHIVDVVDWDTEPLPWIAMEYMDGGDLSKWVDTAHRKQLWIAETVTEAVLHAHRRGVAHLDLKPENILFRSVEDGWDVPKVADWGLSKRLLEQSQSREGMTVEYAAPEQFSDSDSADNSTDIYQLGAVFYELFTGQPPFEGEMFDVMEQTREQQPTPPSELAEVPDGLDELLGRALAKEPENRYSDIVYLRDDLQELFEAAE